MTGIIVALAVLGAFLISAVKILPEYQRGVVFFLGKFQKVKGPGLIIVLPAIQQMVRVDLRVITMDVPTQDVISRDNVTVRVSAVLYFRVVDHCMLPVQQTGSITTKYSSQSRFSEIFMLFHQF